MSSDRAVFESVLQPRIDEMAPLAAAHSASLPLQQPLPPDRLGSLPAEILSLIFDQVGLMIYRHKPGTLGPISKRLLPYTRRNVFWNVRIPSYKALDHFLRSLDDEWNVLGGTNELSHLVERLRINMPYSILDSWTPAKAASLLERLSRLKSLSISKPNEFVGAVLSHQLAPSSLQYLEFLSLPDPHLPTDPLLPLYCCNTFPLAPSCYSSLRSFKRLNRLDITSNFRESGLRPVIEGAAAPNETVRMLDIHGSLGRLRRSLGVFLGHFAGLERLTLWSVDSSIGLRSFGTTMPTLRHLAVYSNSEPATPGPIRDTLDQVLQYFPSLETLAIGTDAYTPTFCSLLTQCQHLEDLLFAGTLGHRHLVFHELELLVGPKRPPALRSITISNILMEGDGVGLLWIG